MNLLHEKRRALGVHRPCKGGSAMSMATSETTNNTDRRVAADDSVIVGDGSSASVSMTTNSYTQSADAEVLRAMSQSLPDSVRALGQMGATTLRDLGGAVVDLNRDSIAQNTKSWDATVQAGAKMVDSMIDQMSADYGLVAKGGFDVIKDGFGFAKDSYDLADKMLDRASKADALAAKVVDSFTPTENKNADIGKYAMLAAAAVAAAVLLSKGG